MLRQKSVWNGMPACICDMQQAIDFAIGKERAVQWRLPEREPSRRPVWMFVRQAEPSSAPVSAVTESALMARAVMPAAQMTVTNRCTDSSIAQLSSHSNSARYC